MLAIQKSNTSNIMHQSMIAVENIWYQFDHITKINQMLDDGMFLVGGGVGLDSTSSRALYDGVPQGKKRTGEM